jgi:hypothetical protein
VFVWDDDVQVMLTSLASEPTVTFDDKAPRFSTYDGDFASYSFAKPDG